MTLLDQVSLQLFFLFITTFIVSYSTFGKLQPINLICCRHLDLFFLKSKMFITDYFVNFCVIRTKIVSTFMCFTCVFKSSWKSGAT